MDAARHVTEAARLRYVEPDLAMGDRVAADGLLRSLGLPDPWPPVVQRAGELGRALDMRFRVTPRDSVEGQWNGLTGVVPFEPTPPPDASQTFVAHVMRERARGMYCVVHEVAHGLLYEVAARGALRRCADDMGEMQKLHILSEAYAGFVSHYELGLESHGYWQKWFPPLAERSGLHAGNAGTAAVRAGMQLAEQRLSFMLQTYFGAPEDPWPLTIEELLPHADLTEQWLHERRYAEKTRNSSRAWWIQYWSAPPVRDALLRFTPKTPAPIHLDGEPEPLELDDLEVVLPRLHRLFDAWRPGPPGFARLMTARREALRSALALAQLQRYLAHDDVLIAPDVRRDCLVATERGLDDLDRLRLFSSPDAVLSEARAAEVAEQTRAAITRVHDVVRRRAGDVVQHRHPLWRGADMSDAIRIAYADGVEPDPVLDVARAAETGHGLATRRLVTYLSLLAADAREAACASTDPALAETAITLAGLHARAGAALATGARVAETAAAVGATLQTLHREDLLRAHYRTAWLLEAPQIDPLVGFRVG